MVQLPVALETGTPGSVEGIAPVGGGIGSVVALVNPFATGDPGAAVGGLGAHVVGGLGAHVVGLRAGVAAGV